MCPLLQKCSQHNVGIEHAKAMLSKLAEDERRLFRMASILRRADEMTAEDPAAEQKVDKPVLHQCERWRLEEERRTTYALKALARSSDDGTES